ncbi:unnamed protein product [Peniophora sp. CBMAI 1063]|nr:unnamed protein product [Peniophora sp. CBMAI 1063]
MTQRLPWINAISQEMKSSAVGDIFKVCSALHASIWAIDSGVIQILLDLAHPRLGVPMPRYALRRYLSTGEPPRDQEHAEPLSQLRAHLPVQFRLAGTDRVSVLESHVYGILESIFDALLVVQNPSFLYARLMDIDIVPTSDDYADFVTTYHHVLRWSIWRLYAWTVVGLPPPSICLINNLPAEILGKVFGFVSQPSENQRPTFLKVTYVDQSRDVSSHLPLRLVCKHWSILIDDTPTLWSRMVKGFGDFWTERALRASKDTDLFVAVTQDDFLYGHLIDNAQRLLGHASRFSTLSLSGLTWDAIAQITLALGMVPLDRLVSLTVEAHGPNARIPTHMFTRTSHSRLTTLKVMNCRIQDPRLALRHSLTRLTLIWCDVWMSIDDMFATLLRCPGLVRFEWCMSQNSRAWISGGTHELDSAQFLSSTRARRLSTVALPHLQYIALECHAAVFNAILSGITLPSQYHVRLLDDYDLIGERRHDLEVMDSILQGLDSSLGAHYSTSRSPGAITAFRTIAINEVTGSGPSDRNAFTVHGSTKQSLPHSQFAQQDFMEGASTFTITFLIPSAMLVNDHERLLSIHEDVVTRFVAHILAWPSMRTNVQKLVTGHAIHASPPVWSSTLALVPQLVELYLEYTPSQQNSSIVYGFASALSLQHRLIPNLRKLSLGPLAGLDSFDRDALIHAIHDRHKAYDYPEIAVNLVNVDEWLDEDEVDEFKSMVAATGAGWVEVVD